MTSLNNTTLTKVTYGKYATWVLDEVAFGIYEWFSSQYIILLHIIDNEMFLGSACQSQIPKGRAILPFDWFIHWGLILARCYETLVIFCIICIMISMKNYLILIGWRWEKLASRKMFRHFLYTNFLMFIIYKWSYDFPHSIGHVRYINIQAWLQGFRVKIANFSSFFC